MFFLSLAWHWVFCFQRNNFFRINIQCQANLLPFANVYEIGTQTWLAEAIYYYEVIQFSFYFEDIRCKIFFRSSPILWNTLPSDIMNSSSVSVIQNNLRWHDRIFE